MAPAPCPMPSLQLHEISRGGLQNAIEAVQATHPQLASLIVPPEPSPAAATALQLLQAAQSSRSLPRVPPPAQQSSPQHQLQARQPSCNSDSSAATAAVRLMAGLSALHQQQQPQPQPHPAPAPPPQAPAPQQHTIRVVTAAAPQRPNPGTATVVHVQQVAPPPLLTAVGMFGGGPKGSSPNAGAFSAAPNGASGLSSRDWSLDGGSASDGSQGQARKRARLDFPTPAANGASSYAPPPSSSNGKVRRHYRGSSEPLLRPILASPCWQAAALLRAVVLVRLLLWDLDVNRSPPPPACPRPAPQVCSNCHTSNTPFWRKDRHTGLPLCNACGLYAAKNDHPRPVKLWREGQAPGQPQHRQPSQALPPQQHHQQQQGQQGPSQEQQEQQEQANAASAVEALHQLQSLQKDSPSSSPTQQQQRQRSRSSSPPEAPAVPAQHGAVQQPAGNSPPPAQQPALQPQVQLQQQIQVQVVRSMPTVASHAAPASHASPTQPESQAAAQQAQRQHDAIPPDMLAQAAAALLATAISATTGAGIAGQKH